MKLAYLILSMVFVGAALSLPFLAVPTSATTQAAPLTPKFGVAPASSGVWWVGASSTDSSAMSNSGVKSNIQVINFATTGCLAFWAADGLTNGEWAQIGYYLCSGGAPVSFYQIWNLGTNTILGGGTGTVTAGTHAFSMYLQSGTTWAFAVDGTVLGTFDMGASTSSATYPVEIFSEEQGASVFVFPAVTFTNTMQVLKSGSWGPVQTAVSYGTAWGIQGNLQNSNLPNNEIVIGGALGILSAGTPLWSSGSTSSTSSSSTTTLAPPTVTVTVTSTVTQTVTQTSTMTSTQTLPPTTTTVTTSSPPVTSTQTLTQTSTTTSTTTLPGSTTTSTVTSTAPPVTSTQTSTQTVTQTSTITSTVTIPASTTTTTVTNTSPPVTSTQTVTKTTTTTSTTTLPGSTTTTTVTSTAPPVTSTQTSTSTLTQTSTTTSTKTLPASSTTTVTITSIPPPITLTSTSTTTVTSGGVQTVTTTVTVTSTVNNTNTVTQTSTSTANLPGATITRTLTGETTTVTSVAPGNTTTQTLIENVTSTETPATSTATQTVTVTTTICISGTSTQPVSCPTSNEAPLDAAASPTLMPSVSAFIFLVGTLVVGAIVVKRASFSQDK